MGTIAVADFYLVDTYTLEVFSTDKRNFVFGLLDTISKIGTTVTPFIVDLGGQASPGLPPAIFGCVMIAGGLAFLMTPETKGEPMVQNAKDLSKYHKNTLLKSCCGKAETNVKETQDGDGLPMA